MSPPFLTVPVTVDIIIENLAGDLIVLIERRDEPKGVAIPGGFVEPGESAAQAAIREAKEETGLDVELIEQFFTYSKPGRDPRGPVASVVFIAKAIGIPKAGDDAKEARWHRLHYEEGNNEHPLVPEKMAFDHKAIIHDYVTWRGCGRRPSVNRS